MTFISYAQNFEDVMLWRALRHIKNGCYIDIGANDPIVDSVSRAFYEQGWRGVHLEPTAQYATLLRQNRPDELVIQAAVGDSQKLLTFFEFPDTGLSTLDKDIALEHQARGFRMVQTVTPTLTLDDIFAQLPARDIHWLKIDVEGAETSVLQGWQTSEVRPWIVVIESTLPMSQTPSHQQWEALLLAKGYQFVYFDGLNRYYVSDLHPELMAQPWLPPNLFDGFTIDGRASNVLSQDFQRRLQAAIESGQQSAAATLQDHEQARQTLLNQLAQTRTQLELEATSAREEYQALSSQVRDARDELGQMVRLVSQREQEFAHRFEHFQTDYQAVSQLLQQEREQASTQLQALQQQLQTQQQQYQAELQRHSELEDKLSALQLQLRQKEQAFAGQLLQLHQQKSGQQKVFQIREQSLRTELQRAREEIQRVGEQYQAELQDLRQTHDTLRTESANWQQQYLQLQQESAGQMAQLAAALQQSENGAALQLQQHATELHQIIAELNAARDYIEQHQQQIAQLSTERDQLRNELGRVARGYVELRADFKEKAGRTSAFINALKEQHQIKLRQVSDVYQTVQQQLADELGSAKSEIFVLNSQVNESQETLAALTTSLDVATETISMLNSAREQENRDAESKYQEMSLSLEGVNAKLSTLSAEFSSLQTTAASTQLLNEQLLNDIELLKSENNTLLEQLALAKEKHLEEVKLLKEYISFFYGHVISLTNYFNELSLWKRILSVFGVGSIPVDSKCHEVYFDTSIKYEAGHNCNTENSAMNNKYTDRSQTLKEMYGYSGAQFVFNAFITLLNRTPDAEGSQIYTEQLNSGVSKDEIIYQIVNSQEWNIKKITVPGLKNSLKKVKIGKTPLVGRVISSVLGWPTYSHHAKQLRTIEAKLAAMNELIDARFEKCEDKISVLAARVSNQNTTLNSILAHLHSEGDKSKDLATEVVEVHDNYEFLDNISARSKTIFSLMLDGKSTGAAA